MKTRRIAWLFLVIVVTVLNTWAAYMTASHGWSMVAHDATIVACIVGVVTLMLAWIIVSW